MVSKTMLRTAGATVCALLLAAASQVWAAEGGPRLQTAPIDSHDLASLQNGAKVFVNYCLNCHSAGYMRYNRLRDLGLSEQQIKDNLIFTGVKVGELMQVAMDRKDAKQWFGAPPPDLTVEAPARSSTGGSGADWIYTYLKSFYRDDSRPTGWNNLVFENVGMPHALWQLNGQQQLVTREFESEHEATAALLAAKSVARLDEEVSMQDGKELRRYRVNTLEPGNGTLSPLEYDKLVTDLVNYMNFMAEPARIERHRIGIYVLFLLGVLFIFALLLKKAYWKDVH
jgi:ubiquinol-cytochrome c reductase cytochrome c1 subunit